MSSPACAWPDRASPKWPVTVPFTGAPIRPLVQPPAAGAVVGAGRGGDTGGAGGAGDTAGAGCAAGAGPEPLDPGPLEAAPLGADPLDPEDALDPEPLASD